MSLAQLLTADALHARLAEPGLVLLDCRFALDDPAYGARHLQRNIERRLLGELVRFSERGVSSVRASVRDGEVVISEA